MAWRHWTSTLQQHRQSNCDSRQTLSSTPPLVISTNPSVESADHFLMLVCEKPDRAWQNHLRTHRRIQRSTVSASGGIVNAHSPSAYWLRIVRTSSIPSRKVSSNSGS